MPPSDRPGWGSCPPDEAAVREYGRWWWITLPLWPEPRAVSVYLLDQPRGLVVTYNGRDYGSRDKVQHLGPVARPGAVDPDEHARAVLMAYRDGWGDGLEEGDARAYGGNDRRNRDARADWNGSGTQTLLVARVGAAVVERVERGEVDRG